MKSDHDKLVAAHEDLRSRNVRMGLFEYCEHMRQQLGADDYGMDVQAFALAGMAADDCVVVDRDEMLVLAISIDMSGVSTDSLERLLIGLSIPQVVTDLIDSFVEEARDTCIARAIEAIQSRGHVFSGPANVQVRTSVRAAALRLSHGTPSRVRLATLVMDWLSKSARA